MKKKELKNLATKIAKLELENRNCSDPKKIKENEMEIMKLCGKVTSIEDIEQIDDLVQEILSKNFDK